MYPNLYSNIHGYFNFQSVYNRAVEEYPNGFFIELGSWLGKSTCYMAEMIKHVKKPITFVTVDTFLGEPTAKDQKEILTAITVMIA